MVTIQRVAMMNGLNVEKTFNSDCVACFTSYSIGALSHPCEPIFTRALLRDRDSISKNVHLWDKMFDPKQFYI